MKTYHSKQFPSKSITSEEENSSLQQPEIIGEPETIPKKPTKSNVSKDEFSSLQQPEIIEEPVGGGCQKLGSKSV